MQQEETSGVVVSVVESVTDELAAAVTRLLPTLSSSAHTPTREELDELVSSPATTLFVARQSGGAPAGLGGDIVGMLTLALFRIPTGLRAWIEDVVVDPAAGRHGIGTTLVKAAVDYAEAAGARTVDLTSRPSRDVANRLYRRVGFVQRETTVYRYEMGG